MTTFQDLALLAFAGVCLAAEERELVEPYDVTVPGTLIINLYLVEDTNEKACGSPFTGHVILPTVKSPEAMGPVLAHEIGHVLLNPLGVDDSDQPNHLMFHPQVHPETPPGSRDGLYLSDCVGAQARAREDLFAFGRPGGLGSPEEPIACKMRPQLGNNLVVVATDPAPV